MAAGLFTRLRLNRKMLLTETNRGAEEVGQEVSLLKVEAGDAMGF